MVSTEEIRNMRISKGWTQKEAAEAVGVSLRTWQNWESGVNQINKAAWKLCCMQNLHGVY